jgi:hypothetical protein
MNSEDTFIVGSRRCACADTTSSHYGKDFFGASLACSARARPRLGRNLSSPNIHVINVRTYLVPEATKSLGNRRSHMYERS